MSKSQLTSPYTLSIWRKYITSIG